MEDEKILAAFNELSEKYPDWSFYRKKIQLKKILDIKIEDINAVPFFARRRRMKEAETRLKNAQTIMQIKHQKKMMHTWHYDTNNIITKAIISTSMLSRVNNSAQAVKPEWCTTYHSKHKKWMSI